MGADDESRNALVTLGVGPAAKELYVDLLRPAAVEIGKNLSVVARLVSYALSPFKGIVWSLDAIRDWLAPELLRRLAKTDPENIQQPPAYIAGQVLLQLPFCAEQERLREMYANLLAAAMNKKTATVVHPAFVHVIQQITPDEAMILKNIFDNGLSIRLEQTVDENENLIGEGLYLTDQFKKYCEGAGVASSSRSDAYLDNLLRLKLFDDLQWSEGKFHPPGWRSKHDGHDGYVENTSNRLVQLSSFGEAFLRTCIAD